MGLNVFGDVAATVTNFRKFVYLSDAFTSELILNLDAKVTGAEFCSYSKYS